MLNKLKEMVIINQPASRRFKVLLIYGSALLFLIILVTFSEQLTHKSTQILSRVKLNIFSSDYDRLINMKFTFNMLPLVCEANEVDLLILVHSSVNHFHNREIIRETWGQNQDKIKILFLIGLVEEQEAEKKLKIEYQQYRDLVQGSFLDSYHNLTYKHVMGLKYVVYHCSNTKLIIKVDDDSFVNTPNVKIFLESYSCVHKKPKKIFCSILHTPPVLRKGKWKVSLEDYAETHYPNHCSGFSIIYPYKILYSLYTEAQSSKYFWIDDVHVTGILAERINASHINIDKLILSRKDLRNIVDLSFINITNPFLFGPFNLNEKQIRSLWNFAEKYAPKPSILEYL